jgi:hypothetical protein
LDGADDKNVALVVKGNKKDMSKVKCFACHKTDHYTSQCLNKKKKKPEPEVLASTEVVEFAQRFEKELSLMAGFMGSGCLVFEDIESWFVDCGVSQHMTGLRSIFLDLREIDSDCSMNCGVGPQHAVKGVGMKIPTRVKRSSEGWQGVICSKVDS